MQVHKSVQDLTCCEPQENFGQGADAGHDVFQAREVHVLVGDQDASFLWKVVRSHEINDTRMGRAIPAWLTNSSASSHSCIG
eukprot:1460870-Rhodomonas_salina.2